jgi:hypothetical protein
MSEYLEASRISSRCRPARPAATEEMLAASATSPFFFEDMDFGNFLQTSIVGARGAGDSGGAFGSAGRRGSGDRDGAAGSDGNAGASGTPGQVGQLNIVPAV